MYNSEVFFTEKDVLDRQQDVLTPSAARQSESDIILWTLDTVQPKINTAT